VSEQLLPAAGGGAGHAGGRGVAILPEAASIVFGGGFPRHATDPGRRAAQRAIYRIQREVETLIDEERRVGVALCDRGTIDGVAYWPGSPDSYWKDLGTTQLEELARYAAVIHLEPPSRLGGYDHSNTLRVESAEEAQTIDARITEAWRPHPRRFVVASASSFPEKATRALELIHAELPPCCQSHRLVADSR
jgi:hypothetical protein